GEHSHDHAHHDSSPCAGRVGDPVQDDGHDRDQDVEHHDHAKDLPAVASHQLATAPERSQAGRSLEHHHGCRDRPDRDQDEPGNDDQEEADDDSQPGHDPHQDQLADHGRGRSQQLTRGGVATTVLDVGHELDDH